jgi:phenylalanyl-tRNA synthetase beta chain
MPVINRPVTIDNPISTDQTIVRTGLISGIIEIIAANTSSTLPQRIFETGEVAYINKTTGGPSEEVFAGTGVVDSKIGFSDIKSVLKNLLREMGFAWKLSPNDFGLYLPGRSANVIVNDAAIGHLGEVHPKVLDGFGIPNPVVVLELSLSKMGFIV